MRARQHRPTLGPARPAATQRPTPTHPTAPRTLPPALAAELSQAYGNRDVGRILQKKPVVGPAHDHHEREADRVAARVARATDGSGPHPHGPTAPGQIPEQVRAPMEQAMGADFGDVRLHTDSRADRLNRTLGATAFTLGRDIFFRRGQADFASRSGREVLAHELTHVVQQGRNGTSGDTPTIQRLNHVTTQHTNRVANPLWVLHQAFGADFTALTIPETYAFYSKLFDPAHPDAIFTKGVHDWKNPNRPEYEKATLDGKRPGGARKSEPPQYLYGYLGIMERAIWGRPMMSPPVYEGGHFISDEILGDDSYTEFNFAPQDDQFNAPLWRIYEEMAERGAYHKDHSTRASTWTYSIRVTYPPDYDRTAQELADVGVIPQAVADVDPTKKVTFPRRVPDLWRAKLEAPADHVFPEKQINPGTHAFSYFQGNADDVRKAAMVKQGSGNLNLGIESYRLETVPGGTGTDKYFGGLQVDRFAALQYYPRDIASQPARTVAGPGGVPITPVLPQARASRLKQKVSLSAAIDDDTSTERQLIDAAYPEIAGYVWDKALVWAWDRVQHEPIRYPKMIVDRAKNWQGRSSTKRKPTVSAEQKGYLDLLVRDSNLIL